MRPEDPDEKVVAEFRRRERRQLLAIIPLLLAIVLTKVAHDHTGGTVLGVPAWILYLVATAFVAGAVLFALLNWRCPACNRYLGRGAPRGHCPRCGARLR
jgi:hypothetical protein